VPGPTMTMGVNGLAGSLKLEDRTKMGARLAWAGPGRTGEDDGMARCTTTGHEQGQAGGQQERARAAGGQKPDFLGAPTTLQSKRSRQRAGTKARGSGGAGQGGPSSRRRPRRGGGAPWGWAPARRHT
jgi:hypothetical protein